jgi:hypothetical protein
VHADADVHVRHAGSLGSGQRGELCGLAEHELGSPALDRLDDRGQPGLGVDSREHIANDQRISLLEIHRGQACHEGTDHLGWSVIERLMGEARTPDSAGVRRWSGDAHLVTRLRECPRERHDRPEVAVVSRGGT